MKSTIPETVPKAVTRYDLGNLLAARAILEDPARYGGPTAALVEWARATVARAAAPPADAEAGPLFAGRAA